MTQEKVVRNKSGWLMLAVVIALLVIAVMLEVLFLQGGGGFGFRHRMGASGQLGLGVLGILVFLVALFLCNGFYTLQPNEAKILVLFGNYKGTAERPGFYWNNPFYSKSIGTTTRGCKISLRARTMNGERIKVNDKRGNPIEIAMVVVWHVADTAKAVFDVENYQGYVATQSETALRHVATAYSYDLGEGGRDTGELTLRSNVEEVSESLKEELAERLAIAGVVIDDARLTHLAYAPEIAQAMLRRQQAEAIIAARQKIVEGAVGMVEMALDQLEGHNVLELDDEHKTAMVSNLMVVLCSDSDAQPIVNTGTLTQ